MYFFNETDSKWYWSSYTENPATFTETVDEIKKNLIPAEAELGTITINGKEYLVANYVDNAGSITEEVTSAELAEKTIMYCFSVDGEALNIAYIITYADEMGYIFMTVDTSDIELPEELATAEEGNFEEYMAQIFLKLLEESNNMEPSEDYVEEETINEENVTVDNPEEVDVTDEVVTEEPTTDTENVSEVEVGSSDNVEETVE